MQNLLLTAYRINGELGLTINDTIQVTQKVQKSSKVILDMRNGYLGGRPGKYLFNISNLMNLQTQYFIA